MAYDGNTYKEEPVRIAEVLGNAATGGVMNWLMNFYRHIDRSRIQFDFYMYAPSAFDDEIRALGGRVFYYPRVVTHVFGAIRTLKKAFKKEKYPIVHVHMTTLSFVALYAAKRAGVKRRICHAHSTADRAEGWKWIVKNMLKPLAGLFATDLAGCSELGIDWLFGRKAKDAVLIHNAIDTARFAGAYAEVAAADADDEAPVKTIGFIGRLEKQKNVGYLVEVFKDIANKRDDVRLLIVGAGKEYMEIVEKVKKLGLTERVEFRDWCNDIERYYAEIDVLALPSLFEGLPMVAVEAQAAGIPCVLSDNITKEAAVTPKCEFVPLADRGKWAEALSRALDEGREYGTRALEGSAYDIRTEADKLTEYYLEKVAEGGNAND